jgi:hypothetical protein
MLKLGMLVFMVAIAGCGSGSSGGVNYPLPGASQFDIPPGQCIVVNTAPQTLPLSVVSYDLVDAGGSYADAYEVGVVPSSYTCLFNQYKSYVDDTFVGSAATRHKSRPGPTT